MAKFWIFATLFVVAIFRITYALNLAEAINVSIREQLNLYDKFQKEADSAKYADELNNLFKLTEAALKIESADEKKQVLSSIPSHFLNEFNNWIVAKLTEARLNDSIERAIEFYKTLLASHSEYETEIKETISSLENILKESNLTRKEDKFVDLGKSFSPDFQKLIKESDLPNINNRLQTTLEFFNNLLEDKDIKYAKEIEALKAKAEAALNNNVSIDDKKKVLHEITFTDNGELNEFLLKKDLEYL